MDEMSTTDLISIEPEALDLGTSVSVHAVKKDGKLVELRLITREKTFVVSDHWTGLQILQPRTQVLEGATPKIPEPGVHDF